MICVFMRGLGPGTTNVALAADISRTASHKTSLPVEVHFPDMVCAVDDYRSEVIEVPKKVLGTHAEERRFDDQDINIVC